MSGAILVKVGFGLDGVLELNQAPKDGEKNGEESKWGGAARGSAEKGGEMGILKY